MQIEPTNDADIVCKDLIGETYEAVYKEHGGFSGLDALWEKIEKALARKDALNLCTTRAEDNEAMGILEEVFEGACLTAQEEGHVASPAEYVDYKALWERLMVVIQVSV